MHSIRIKITAVIIAAILTSVFALGAIGILTIGMESDQTSVERLRLISENTQQRLDAYLDSIQQSVEMAVHTAGKSLDEMDLTLLGASSGSEEANRRDAVLTAHCAEVEKAFSNIADITNGIVTYYYCINADFYSPEHGFFWSKRGNDVFVKQPAIIASDLDLNDTEHTTWYFTPLKTGRACWVGPYKARSLGEAMTISYVAPIYHYGFLIGVLGMDILFDTMVSQISSLRIYDTGFVLLLDKEGTLLYHPLMESGTVPEFVREHKSEDLYKRSSSGNTLIRYSVNGEERQMAFSTLRNKIKIAVTAPVSEINASRRRLTLMILLVALVILAVFTVLTMLMVNALTKPLVRLAAASRKLMDGDYSAELAEYNRKDELGTLTQSFRKMRDHMKLYISDLNSRAYTDALTGVKNKGALNIIMDRLDSEITQSEQKPCFAFIVFDCDDLKEINDEYGHERGNLYLQTACRMICDVFAHSPVYRLGGDEFGVLLQQQDYHARDELIARFDRNVAEWNGSAEYPWEKVSMSRGMAVFRENEDTNTEQVIVRADEEMYRNKRKRKGH